MILGYNGQKVFCRSTEEKILLAMENDHKSSKKISVRDTVIVKGDLSKEYILWNTPLVRVHWQNDVYIFIASNMEERGRYWQPNGFSIWQPRDYIISNTTKSRLNAFLNYYGFNSLEVHSTVKNWSVKYNGEKLKVDSWYKLDLKNKKLLPAD